MSQSQGEQYISKAYQYLFKNSDKFWLWQGSEPRARLCEACATARKMMVPPGRLKGAGFNPISNQRVRADHFFSKLIEASNLLFKTVPSFASDRWPGANPSYCSRMFDQRIARFFRISPSLFASGPEPCGNVFSARKLLPSIWRTFCPMAQYLEQKVEELTAAAKILRLYPVVIKVTICLKVFGNVRSVPTLN